MSMSNQSRRRNVSLARRLMRSGSAPHKAPAPNGGLALTGLVLILIGLIRASLTTNSTNVKESATDFTDTHLALHEAGMAELRERNRDLKAQNNTLRAQRDALTREVQAAAANVARLEGLVAARPEVETLLMPGPVMPGPVMPDPVLADPVMAAVPCDEAPSAVADLPVGELPLIARSSSPIWPRSRFAVGPVVGGAPVLTPRRALTAVAVVLAIALVAAGANVIVGAKTASVVVGVAGPSTIDDTPSGLGVVSPAVEFRLTIDDLDITQRIAITDVDVVDGSKVTKGEPLLGLDPTPLLAQVGILKTKLQVAQQSLTSAQQALLTLDADPMQAQLAALETSVDTLQNETTQAQQTGNAATIDQAEDNLLSAQAALGRAQDALSSDQLVALSRRGDAQALVTTEQGQVALQTQLLAIAQGNGSTVSSPIAGVVTAVDVLPGDAAISGKTLIEVVDPSTLRVSADIPIAEVGDVHAGQPATIRFPATPGLAISATVVAVSDVAVGGGLEVPVMVEGANRPDDQVLLGAQALVEVAATVAAKVTVPDIAIASAVQDPEVFVVRHGHAIRVAVVIGHADENRTEILSGLAPGDEVVLAGMQTLVNGSAVRVHRTET